MSLYNLVTDNIKEYDFDTEYCLNIYISRNYAVYNIHRLAWDSCSC
jgi:hypothetical protein